MNHFLTLAGDPAGGMNIIVVVVIYAVVLGGLYFFLIRPQSKKKKKEEKMRKNVQIGDEITTIGGISGRVVGIKEDADCLILETGTDRAKLRVKRWALGSVDTIHDEVES